jgi:hypothetical protein
MEVLVMTSNGDVGFLMKGAEYIAVRVVQMGRHEI